MRTKAIVLNKTPAGEYDALIDCYTEDFGAMRLLARGIMRPRSVQALHVDAGNLVEFEVIPGRSLPIIAGAQMIAQYGLVKAELSRGAAVSFFLEVIDRIAFENERDPELWSYLTAMLERFNTVPRAELMSVFRDEQNKFLDVLGYAPRIDRCVICSEDPMEGSEKLVAMSPDLGGVLCANCFLETGRGLLFNKADVAGLGAGRTAGAALDSFFEYTLGTAIHSLAFLYQVIQ